ncbi:MAG: DNA replication/repair protein RecF [Sphingobium sp.]|nr:DNA replication/repair protein RecF [Sphingobium sp.]
MPIARLSLTDFRNHADALIAPTHDFILLTGENGAGKTNILEAVSMLAPGRGLRGAALHDMARQGGGGGFGIAASVDGVTIGTGTSPDAPDRRQVRIDGQPQAANALAERLAIIWLTPAMDRLFTESPGGRRRFLDRLVLALNPAHAHHVGRYEAAMRSRNKLLTDLARADPAWLGALESQMAEHGTAIASAREDAVAALRAAVSQLPEQPFARPDLAITEWTSERADQLIQDLAAGRRADAAARRTLVGPHRSDLSVAHAGKQQPAALCSTGEQKAMLLSILLAHAALVRSRRAQAPIVLLDEVAAHLDPARRAVLFDRLAAMGSQVWMTGTEAELFDGIGAATRFIVSGGVLHATN